jgi:hypothetical protein
MWAYRLSASATWNQQIATRPSPRVGCIATYQDEAGPEGDPGRIVKQRAFEGRGRVGGSVQCQTDEKSHDAPVVSRTVISRLRDLLGRLVGLTCGRRMSRARCRVRTSARARIPGTA